MHEHDTGVSGGPHQAIVERLRAGMEQGVLSFPLTAFDEHGEVNLPAFRSHVRAQLEAGPAAIFPCCGTGEFFSLSEPEYAALVTAAVEEADGRVPVVAGAGYGWAQASRFTAAAEKAGADAVLLMPPYLINGPQQGLVEHVRQVASRTPLPVIVYQRAQVKFTAASVPDLAAISGVIGLKDAHGDMDLMQRLKLAAPAEWLFFNGASTAELQVRQYSSVGVRAYSSAVHCFAPEIAKAFFRAHQADDNETMEALLSGFFIPLVELRDQGVGYAVSLIKAAANVRGANTGPVRAPLVDPTGEHIRQLEALIETGLQLVTEKAPVLQGAAT
jgi:5-dehydro-4-deoxyglucarate dehydratase